MMSKLRAHGVVRRVVGEEPQKVVYVEDAIASGMGCPRCVSPEALDNSRPCRCNEILLLVGVDGSCSPLTVYRFRCCVLTVEMSRLQLSVAAKVDTGCACRPPSR